MRQVRKRALVLGVIPSPAGLAQHPELLVNVTGAPTGIASPTADARDTIGRYGMMIPGLPATYHLGGGFAALLTPASSSEDGS